MFMRNLSILALSFAFVTAAYALEAPHLGRPATPDYIKAYELDAMPDGRFLPEGHGTAKEGEAIFVEKCQSCHGEKGVKGIALALVGGQGTIGKNEIKPLRTVGSYWPYAPSIFSYIRRAMPYYESKSLSTDEIYALTAYLLALNKLIGEQDEMNAKTLGQVKMPWRDHFRPFKRGD